MDYCSQSIGILMSLQQFWPAALQIAFLTDYRQLLHD